MIEDARVLKTEFVPREVVHRDQEVQYLSSVLRPITDDLNPDPAFLHGPSGSGKTCIARFVVERLRENVVDINTQYVNCWEDHTRFKALHRILEGIDKSFDIHRQSTPRDVLVERLNEYDGPPYVVILDEIDQLQDKGILYDLYRAPEITMILISNEEISVLAGLDDRIISRLNSAERIRFSQYTEDELTEILSDRANWGLKNDAVTEDQLRWIADASAGDARTAIGVLRNAAKRSQSEKLERVPNSKISNAIPETHKELRQTDLDRLTDDQRLLVDLIEDAGEISPKDVYAVYEDRVENPKTLRTIRSYLKKLEHYNLLEAKGTTRDRKYRTVTNAPKAPVSGPTESVP